MIEGVIKQFFKDFRYSKVAEESFWQQLEAEDKNPEEQIRLIGQYYENVQRLEDSEDPEYLAQLLFKDMEVFSDDKEKKEKRACFSSACKEIAELKVMIGITNDMPVEENSSTSESGTPSEIIKILSDAIELVKDLEEKIERKGDYYVVIPTESGYPYAFVHKKTYESTDVFSDNMGFYTEASMEAQNFRKDLEVALENSYRRKDISEELKNIQKQALNLFENPNMKKAANEERGIFQKIARSIGRFLGFKSKAEKNIKQVEAVLGIDNKVLMEAQKEKAVALINSIVQQCESCTEYEKYQKSIEDSVSEQNDIVDFLYNAELSDAELAPERLEDPEGASLLMTVSRLNGLTQKLDNKREFKDTLAAIEIDIDLNLQDKELKSSLKRTLEELRRAASTYQKTKKIVDKTEHGSGLFRAFRRKNRRPKTLDSTEDKPNIELNSKSHQQKHR